MESRKDFYFGDYKIYSDSNKTETIGDGKINVPIEGITGIVFSLSQNSKKSQ